MPYRFLSHSPEETEHIGTSLACTLQSDGAPSFVALYGDLGAGKTAFARGFVSVLSPGSRVRSPTYTIVNEYRRGPVPVFHFDFYRLESAESLDSIGFDEYLETGFCIAEWAERLGDNLPSDAVRVTIEKTSETERMITVVKEKGALLC